jgi:Family of unknown function (DUF6516)
MVAKLLLRERVVLSETAFLDLVVWQVPEPVRGSDHLFKYRLALVSKGTCVVRYDNEAGKGDHKHIGDVQHGYRFASVGQLQQDFLADVKRWEGKP